MTACLEELAALQEEQPTMLPRQVAQDIWEELHWRFWEEVREALRQMRRELGRDSATSEQLAFCALMPGPTGAPRFTIPQTFDLNSTTG